MNATELLNVYPYNLARVVLNEDSLVLEINIQGIEKALSTLTDREQVVLEHRFKQKMTLDQCGVVFRVTRERVRQIEAKALRKLRHPTRVYMMKCVSLKQFSDLSIEHRKLQEDFRVLKEEYESLLKAFEGDDETWDYDNEQTKLLNTTIDTLELSIRSKNVLARARKITLGDITEMTYQELANKRNAGRKTVDEIVRLLKSFGLDLKDSAGMEENE